ncbi:unnamed protein product, partial [Ectocarpus fasciculatus]
GSGGEDAGARRRGGGQQRSGSAEDREGVELAKRGGFPSKVCPGRPAGGQRHDPGGQDSREDDDPGAQDGNLVLLQLPAAQARPGQLFFRRGGKRLLVVVFLQSRDHHTAPDVLGREEPHGEVLQVGPALPEGVHQERRGGVAHGVEGRAGCVRRGVYRAGAVRPEDGGGSAHLDTVRLHPGGPLPPHHTPA